MAHLYYGEPSRLIDTERLRDLAVHEVTSSKLITQACNGDIRAAIALLRFFWPFVWAFEKIIDRTTLPRKPLVARFGTAHVAATFRATAEHLKEMAREEGIHSAVWADDAFNLGLILETPDLDEYDAVVADAVPGVRELIESADSRDLLWFFAVLAGTEFIAEELSRRLASFPLFGALFASGFFKWGKVHLATHEGPSHLDIDLDLARAYCQSTDSNIARVQIESAVAHTIRLFGKAAEDVYAHEFDSERIAAE